MPEQILPIEKLAEALGAWQILSQLGLQVRFEPEPDKLRLLVTQTLDKPQGHEATPGPARYEIALPPVDPGGFVRDFPGALAGWRAGALDQPAYDIASGCQVRRHLFVHLRALRDRGFCVPTIPGPDCLVHRFDRMEGTECPVCHGTFSRQSPSLLVSPWRRWLKLKDEQLERLPGGDRRFSELIQVTDTLTPLELVEQWVLGVCALPLSYEDLVRRWTEAPCLEGATLGLVVALRQDLVPGQAGPPGSLR